MLRWRHCRSGKLPVSQGSAVRGARIAIAPLHQAVKYLGHTPLTVPQKWLLAVGTAFGSYKNPRRGDLVATLGETTATPYWIYKLRDAMLSSETGRRILRDRPRITSQTLSLSALRTMPANTLGWAYASWLDKEGVSPDTRSSVRYIDDEECAYVMQRYRECHDFYHAITGLPIIVEGELALKGFEYANTLLPMTGLSLAAMIRLKRAEKIRLVNTYLPWAFSNGIGCKDIINIYWEEELDKDINELREELGIQKPPDLRGERKKAKHEQRGDNKHE